MSYIFDISLMARYDREVEGSRSWFIKPRTVLGI